MIIRIYIGQYFTLHFSKKREFYKYLSNEFYLYSFSMDNQRQCHTAEKDYQNLPPRNSTPQNKGNHRPSDIKNQSFYDKSQQSILRYSGAIFEHQFGLLIARIFSSSPLKNLTVVAKNEKPFVKSLNMMMQNQFLELVHKVEEKKSKNEVVELQQFKLIFSELLPKQKIHGEVDFILDKDKNTTYGEYHQIIKDGIERISQNDQNSNLWMIDNCMGFGQNHLQNRQTNVKFLFQIKRNIFSNKRAKQINESEKKQNDGDNPDSKAEQKIQQQFKEQTKRKEEQMQTINKVKKANEEEEEEEEEEETKPENKGEEKKQNEPQISFRKRKKQQKKLEQVDKKKSVSSNNTSSQIKKEKEAKIHSILKNYANSHNKNLGLLQKMKTTRILENIAQLFKISMIAKHVNEKQLIFAGDGEARNTKVSVYLVINKNMSKNQFEQDFKPFKEIVKFWFSRIGAVLHVIGYSPRHILASENIQKSGQNARILELQDRIKERETQMAQMMKEINDLRKKAEEKFEANAKLEQLVKQLIDKINKQQNSKAEMKEQA